MSLLFDVPRKVNQYGTPTSDHVLARVSVWSVSLIDCPDPVSPVPVDTSVGH